MDRIPRLSEAVYVELCRKIGTRSEIRFRREIADIEEVVTRSMFSIKGPDMIKSGSFREGFRFKTSDVDWMLWLPDHKVICELPQEIFYRLPQHTLILMDIEEVPPGFTRLKLITQSHNELVRSSCLYINYALYLSSSLFREQCLQNIKNTFFLASSIEHGPCATFEIHTQEIDLAVCLHSPHWPIIALPWIHRCVKKKWPDRSVLSDILNKGCHVVPISSVPSCTDKNSEWRISFSMAEQRLVYSMNHSQFLCYGLLKIFLKEVINLKSNNPILCSYFMKTILFWVIQNESSLIWAPRTILLCFWKCFRLFIHWVRMGECPNFFIPQNNMFILKVSGPAQSQLLCQLYNLYRIGIPCLLLSPTLRPYLSQAIIHKTLSFSTDERSIKSSNFLHIGFFAEITRLLVPFRDLTDFTIFFRKIENLLQSALTPFQIVTIQSMTSELLCNTVFYMQKYLCTCTNISNKNLTYLNHISYNLLKLVSKIGCVSDILYLCIYCYRTGRYHQSLRYLQKAQKKMTVPCILYNDVIMIDRYRRVMLGVSLSYKMRKAVMFDIKLYYPYTYLDELRLEQKVSPMPVLFIPPLVMLCMLSALNHYRLGDTNRSRHSLQDLRNLLLHDVGYRVPMYYRDISWQILGICQQICGDYVDAFNSYQYSLQQYPQHRIQKATILRMERLFKRTENHV